MVSQISNVFSIKNSNIYTILYFYTIYKENYPFQHFRARNSVSSYAEEFGTNLPQLRKRSRSRSSSWGSYAYAARPLDEIKVHTNQERKCAWDATQALQINLQSSNPSFINAPVSVFGWVFLVDFVRYINILIKKIE